MRSRTTTTPARFLGHLRVPILALLAGVGFVVAGSTTPGHAPRWTTVRDSVRVAETYRDSVTLPGIAVSAFLSPGHGTAGKRSTGNRPSGSGLPDAGFGLGSAPAHLLPSSSDSEALEASAGRALARAGRLSAPSTAPPTFRL